MDDRTEDAALRRILPVSVGGEIVPLRTLTIEESDAWLALVREARERHSSGEICLSEDDEWLVSTDAGEFGHYMGERVLLDVPYEIPEWEEVNEAEYRGRKVKLNKPFRTPGGPKKFAVYTKNDKGNVIKLGFGSPDMSVKAHSPERARSFLARHNCDTPGPRWKARWWSCNLHRYKKQLGLNFKGRW
jgi:hypothetical protein